MKVRALTNFGGQYAMFKGDEGELPDNPVTRSLIAGGFIEEAESQKKASKSAKKGKKKADTESAEPEEAEADTESAEPEE